MAAAQLVMQSWGEDYLKMLIEAGLDVDLLRGYVDDGRQKSTTLAKGMRFNKDEMRFMVTEEGLVEDETLKETTNQRMARICLPAMNAVNPDLVFTIEAPEDFKDNRLPTLDFFLWLESWGINHSFFAKEMNSPFVIMQQSAMGGQQKSSILANELVRRLSNVNQGHVSREEIIEIIEKFIRQLKTSGYEQKQARDLVLSGLKGRQSKTKRREREGLGFYRQAKHTLQKRVQKKLTERETWYRDDRKDEEDLEDRDYDCERS